MKKIALITGATAGIGKETAYMLAQNNYNLIIIGRRKILLENLAQEIIEKFKVNVLPLNFDIRNLEQVNLNLLNLPGEWKNIDLLVNNAGLASGLGSIQNGIIDDWEKMIDTNIKGLLYVSRAVMPVMIEQKKGQIINVSSIAGKETYADGNVYCATKHAVESITKAMRIDMLPHGIKVSSVAPGMVETEFSIVRFHGDKAKADSVYKGFTPLTPKDIADTIEFIITRPNHVNINDILIMPTAQASSSHIKKDI